MLCREAAADVMLPVSNDGIIVTAAEDNSPSVQNDQNSVEETF